MSMQDPISDMLTCIRNAQSAHHCKVIIPFSNFKFAVATVMYMEGYIKRVKKICYKNLVFLEIYLKYFKGKPVIEELQRISRPSVRIYRKNKYLTRIRGGLGIAIISTSHGVMTNIEAKNKKIGGELVCYVI